MQRVGVLVHPTRPVQGALDTLRGWTEARGIELVQVQTGDQPAVAPAGDAPTCDLLAAAGGDGTVLTALHAAAKTGTPVLGIACGSLGALTAVPASQLEEGLDRFADGDWLPRRLPALVVATADGKAESAVNDVVLVRRAGVQLIVDVWVGDDLYVRSAGDGIVVATPLGSSAYSMAAGGPLLAAGSKAFVCTPLAMHGGCGPPLVIPGETEVVLEVDPGHGVFELEVDGTRVESTAGRFVLGLQDGYATLVALGEPGSGLPGLRARGLIADSPRVLARDARAARAAPSAPERAPGGSIV